MAIANSDGSIILSTKVDTSGINKGMSQMQGKTTSLAKTFSKLGAAVASAFAIQKIIQFSNETGKLATQTEASVQRLVDIYGSASDSVGDFIDQNARALGMSKAAAASYASVYGNLFGVWADQATNAELTNRYLQMTAVIASKTGRTVEDVQERIRSGLLGNTEAIEDLGVFVNVKTIEMTDAFQRMANGKSWEQLDAYTQQQIRSMAILEQATAKYGNEVADTSATIRNRYKAAYEDFKNSWGTIINKILIPVLETLTQIFNIATSTINAFSGESGEILENAQLQQGITEKTTKNIENQVKSQKDLNKEMKKTLAGFDDIQILSSSAKEEDNFSLDIGSIFGESSPKETTKELSAFEKKIREIVEKIKISFEPLKTSLKDFFVPLKESANNVKDTVLVPFGDWILNSFVPIFAQTLASGVNLAQTSFKDLGDTVNSFWTDTASPIFTDIGEIITNVTAKIGDMFSYISEQISINKDDISSFVEFIGGVINIIWGVVKPVIEHMFSLISNTIMTIVDITFNFISVLGNLYKFVKNLILAVIELFKGNFDQAGEYMKESLKSFVNVLSYLVNVFSTAINMVFGWIFNVFKTAVNAIGGLIEKIGGFFGADWDLHWDAEAPRIPAIPKLAQGTVVPPNKEFMAILGDNKKEHEIVSPLSTIEQAVENVLGRQGGTTKEEHYYLNESELMTIVYKLFKGGEHLNGMTLEEGGY